LFAELATEAHQSIFLLLQTGIVILQLLIICYQLVPLLKVNQIVIKESLPIIFVVYKLYLSVGHFFVSELFLQLADLRLQYLSLRLLSAQVSLYFVFDDKIKRDDVQREYRVLPHDCY
jgi:hypothetical protein